VESASFFIPSTSSCSFSSWFTSSWPHHSTHLCCHHLSLHQPFTLDSKLICFTNPFLHILSGSIWSLDCLHGSWTWAGLNGHWRLFVLVSSHSVSRNGIRFIMQVPEFGGKNGPKIQKIGWFYTAPFNLWSRICPEQVTISKIGKTCDRQRFSCVRQKIWRTLVH